MPQRPERRKPQTDCRSLNDDDLVASMAAELRQYDVEAIGFGFPPIVAMQMVGLVQLALKHPGPPANVRQTAVRFIGTVRHFFQNAPAICEMIRRGFVGDDCITCPHCGMTSHHPNDIQHGYCGACHRFEEDQETVN